MKKPGSVKSNLPVSSLGYHFWVVSARTRCIYSKGFTSVLHRDCVYTFCTLLLYSLAWEVACVSVASHLNFMVHWKHFSSAPLLLVLSTVLFNNVPGVLSYQIIHLTIISFLLHYLSPSQSFCYRPALLMMMGFTFLPHAILVKLVYRLRVTPPHQKLCPLPVEFPG